MSSIRYHVYSNRRFPGRRAYSGKYKENLYKRHSDVITGRVLDVGGGNETSDRWNASEEEYIAIDIRCDESLDAVADARSLPFADSAFDTVILSTVLEHISPVDCLDVLREAVRVSKSGGNILVAVPFNYQLHDEPFDFWRPTPYGIGDLIDRVDADLQADIYGAGNLSETFLHVAYNPLRRSCNFLGVPKLMSLFVVVHWTVTLFALIAAESIKRIIGENPFYGRYPIQIFAVIRVEETE